MSQSDCPYILLFPLGAGILKITHLLSSLQSPAWCSQPLLCFPQACTDFSHLYQCRPVQSLSHVRLFVTPWIVARQASLSITNSRSLLKLMPIESVMPSSHLILCRPLLLLPPIPPSIRVFSNESALRMRWPKYWSFSFSISPSRGGKMGFSGGSDDKRICLQCRRPGFNPWVRKMPWRREWLPTTVFLPGESHGQRSLAGYSPWGPRVGHDWVTKHMHIGKISQFR